VFSVPKVKIQIFLSMTCRANAQAVENAKQQDVFSMVVLQTILFSPAKQSEAMKGLS